MDGHYFDCSGYGQRDRFIKTVEKVMSICLTYTCGGTTHAEVKTQVVKLLVAPTRPRGVTTSIPSADENDPPVISVHPPDPLDVIDYTTDKKQYDYEIRNQMENHQKVFGLVWEHSTDALQAKAKSHSDYAVTEAALNGIELLRIIKLICYDIEDEKYVPQKVHECKAEFYAMKQGKSPLPEYFTRFKNQVTVIVQCGASLGEDPLIVQLVCKNLTTDTHTVAYPIVTTDALELAKIKKMTMEYTLAVALIMGANQDIYGGMMRSWTNAHLVKRDEWPKSLDEAYARLCKWEGDPRLSPEENSSLSFVSDGGTPRERKPMPWHVHKTCHRCKEKGHVEEFCDKTKTQIATIKAAAAATDAATHVQTTGEHVDADQQLLDALMEDTDYECDLFVLDHHETKSDILQVKDGINGGRINKNWVLLDNQSTADVISYKKLLTNVREVPGSLTIHTQTGKGQTNLMGTLPGYGDVWYHPTGIANILSLAKVAKTRLVTYNSQDGNAFHVTRNNGSTRIFKQSKHGLFFYDMSQKQDND